MRTKIIIFTLCLLLFPLGLLFYKVNYLNLSILPQKVDDSWHFHLTIKPRNKDTAKFPLPKAYHGLKITDEKIVSDNSEIIVENQSDSHLASWQNLGEVKTGILYSAKIDIDPVVYKTFHKDYTQVYPRTYQKYLKVGELSPEELDAIQSLERAILEGDEDKTSAIRKIFYYIDEEIRRNFGVTKIHESLFTGNGSPLVKAKIFNVMARRQKVPSRIVVGIRMPTPQEEARKQKIRFTYANEVFLNNKWIPIDTNRSYFGVRPDNFLVIHRNYDEVGKYLSKKNASYNIQIQRAKMNRFNKEVYRDEVVKSNSWVARLSLYRLPLPLQQMFSTILLIPLGTLVLAFARNLIGIPTLGIFTPIILTLFFKETSFGFGLFFFSVIVGVGILERYVLDKFYLLAVPRLSIILTFVILFMIGYTLVSVDGGFFSQKHLAFFPIVIVATNIERLSIMLAEDGLINTSKTLVGTLVIAVLGYLLFSIPSLEILMFTNPELLFTVIGLLILIGKYKGYRLSEFLRFRDLVRQKKALEGEK
ncbi:MAG: 7TM domain-containing protein [Bacteriovoracaceae bacterium]